MDRLQNTFAIRIGKKGDYNELEKLYSYDLNKLKDTGENNTFIHLELQKYVRALHLHIYVLNSDQIIRRLFTCFIGVNSKFGVLYGHSINFKDICIFLLSCNNCFKQLFYNNEEDDSKFSLCANCNPYSLNVSYQNVEVRIVDNP